MKDWETDLKVAAGALVVVFGISAGVVKYQDSVLNEDAEVLPRIGAVFQDYDEADGNPQDGVDPLEALKLFAKNTATTALDSASTQGFIDFFDGMDVEDLRCEAVQISEVLEEHGEEYRAVFLEKLQEVIALSETPRPEDTKYKQGTHSWLITEEQWAQDYADFFREYPDFRNFGKILAQDKVIASDMVEMPLIVVKGLSDAFQKADTVDLSGSIGGNVKVTMPEDRRDMVAKIFDPSPLEEKMLELSKYTRLGRAVLQFMEEHDIPDNGVNYRFLLAVEMSAHGEHSENALTFDDVMPLLEQTSPGNPKAGQSKAPECPSREHARSPAGIPDEEVTTPSKTYVYDGWDYKPPA